MHLFDELHKRYYSTRKARPKLQLECRKLCTESRQVKSVALCLPKKIAARSFCNNFYLSSTVFYIFFKMINGDSFVKGIRPSVPFNYLNLQFRLEVYRYLFSIDILCAQQGLLMVPWTIFHNLCPHHGVPTRVILDF